MRATTGIKLSHPRTCCHLYHSSLTSKHQKTNQHTLASGAIEAAQNLRKNLHLVRSLNQAAGHLHHQKRNTRKDLPPKSPLSHAIGKSQNLLKASEPWSHNMFNLLLLETLWTTGRPNRLIKTTWLHSKLRVPSRTTHSSALPQSTIFTHKPVLIGLINIRLWAVSQHSSSPI